MMVSVTEVVIRAQFPFWEAALRMEVPVLRAGVIVVTGCGTSYYLAQSLACVFNSAGQPAIAVPGAEWARRPEVYFPDIGAILVLGLSRSGTTTETVQAVRASRARGWATFALSCEAGSEILLAAERGVHVPTDGREGIVMSVSASLRLPSAVSVGNKLNLWNTNPIFRRRMSVRFASDTLARSSPSIRMLPVVGLSKPPSRCKSVDFPQPDGPMIATNSPSCMSIFTPRRAVTLILPTLYDLVKFSVRKMTLIWRFY